MISTIASLVNNTVLRFYRDFGKQHRPPFVEKKPTHARGNDESAHRESRAMEEEVEAKEAVEIPLSFHEILSRVPSLGWLSLDDVCVESQQRGVSFE